jgi:hypothetical protein
MTKNNLVRAESNAVVDRQLQVARDITDSQRLQKRHNKMERVSGLINNNRLLVSVGMELAFLTPAGVHSYNSRYAETYSKSVFTKRGPSIVLGAVPDRLHYAQVVSFDYINHHASRGGFPPTDGLAWQLAGDNICLGLSIYHVAEKDLGRLQAAPDHRPGRADFVASARSPFVFGKRFFEFDESYGSDEIYRRAFNRTSHRAFSPVAGIRKARYLAKTHHQVEQMHQYLSLAQEAIKDDRLNPSLIDCVPQIPIYEDIVYGRTG